MANPFASSDHLLNPQPVTAPNFLTSRPSATARSGRDLPGATPHSPNMPVRNAVGPGNTGFERFLALHRGSRGSRRSAHGSKGGFRYTSGKYKGMTEGEADVAAHRSFQDLGDGTRDQFRQKNAGDLEAERQRELQSQRDQFGLAREFHRQVRADIRAEAGEGPVANSGAKPFDPNAPSGGSKPVTPSSPKRVVMSGGEVITDPVELSLIDPPGGTINGEPARELNARLKAQNDKAAADAAKAVKPPSETERRAQAADKRSQERKNRRKEAA